jgi:hypothetical protein
MRLQDDEALHLEIKETSLVMQLPGPIGL